MSVRRNVMINRVSAKLFVSRELLREHDLVVFDSVKVLDPGDLSVAAPLVEADGGLVTLLRGRLDQKHTPAPLLYLVLDEAQKDLTVTLPLLAGIDGDPVQIVDTIGKGGRSIA